MQDQKSLWQGSRFFCLLGMAFFACLLNAAAVAAQEDPQLSYLQGLVGAAAFEEDRLTFVETAADDPTALSDNDLSSMPYLGLAGQYALAGTNDQVGIDASLLFGWRSASTSVVAGNGQARVEVDSELWLVDVAIGLYAQTMLGENWRLYGAVGPMMLFGEYSDDAEEQDLSVEPVTEVRTSRSQSEFGVGGYARLGLEYRMTRNALIGVAVRGITTGLEFDQTVDADGLNGVQGFVTFTRAY